MKATRYHPSLHLDEAQLAPAEERCPACGSEEPRDRAGLIQRDPALHLLRCDRCGACSASHMPAPRVLDEYYRRYFPQDGPKTTMPRVDRFVDRVRRAMRLTEPSAHLRLLDFGGGDGTLGLALAQRLLSEAGERTVSLTLVDYQMPDVREPDPRLTVTHRRTLDDVDGPFDIVLASAVLEHVPELQGVMERLLALLAPRGWFYARTAYVVPLKRLMPDLDITYPGHVHDLGAPFWNAVPRTYGQPVEVVVSRPSLVETDLRREPAHTIAAWLMKLPARIELWLSARPRTPAWRLVGGWEAVLTKKTSAT